MLTLCVIEKPSKLDLLTTLAKEIKAIQYHLKNSMHPMAQCGPPKPSTFINQNNHSVTMSRGPLNPI